MAALIAHLLTAYAVIGMPWLGYLWYQKAKARILAGFPDARVGLYRAIVAEQILTTAGVLAFWRLAQLNPAALGLSAPRSWRGTLAVAAVIVAFLTWSGFRLRRVSATLRQRVQESVGALLPASHRERRWFAVVSVGAGISEELLFRGFLLYYLAIYVPRFNTPERVLLAGLSFGFAHLYQGKRGIVGTSILGVLLAAFYLLSGSLFLPVAVHIANDLRVLWIFPPPSPESSAAAVEV